MFVHRLDHLMARSLELSERGRDAETRLNNQSAPYAHDQRWALEPAHTRDLPIPLTHTEMLWLSVWRRALRAVTRIARAFRCAWVEWVNLECARVPMSTSAHDSCPLGFMAELETIQRNNNPLYDLEEHYSCRKWCMGGRHVELGAAAVW